MSETATAAAGYDHVGLVSAPSTVSTVQDRLDDDIAELEKFLATSSGL